MPFENQLLEEQFKIKSLLEKYTYAVNLRDWDLYRSCWTDDATWLLGEPINGRHDGINAIMTEVVKTVEGLELFVQMTHAIHITEIGESTAKVVVTLNEIGKPLATTPFPFPSMTILALYFDDLVKVNGNWLFKQRNYRVAYWDTKLLKGQIFQSTWIHKV